MTMQETLTRNMLREAVGRAIFCPQCKRILDCRRAVELDWYRGEELAGLRVLCASCFDAKCANGQIEGLVKDTEFRVEVVDGRKIFADELKKQVKKADRDFRKAFTPNKWGEYA